MNFLILESLEELRKENKKRNFDQTLDLIVNFKNFDPRRESLNTFISLPNIIKKKKICAFLENPSKAVDYVITSNELDKLSQKDIKKIAKEYDFFMANAKLMPKIASKFGKVLGASGKMPNPRIGGVLAQENSEMISLTVEKLSRITRIKSKEASIKIAVGKESMLNDKLLENIKVALKVIIENLPKKEHNIKSVLLKFTMSHPVKIKIKEEIKSKNKKRK